MRYSLTSAPRCEHNNQTFLLLNDGPSARFLFDFRSAWMALKWIGKEKSERWVASLVSAAMREPGATFPMLDIGANAGYFGLMALSLGASRVVFFEPQPGCWERIDAAVRANGWQARAVLVRHPLSSPGKLESGSPLRVPSRGCLGSFNHPLVSDRRSKADGIHDVTAAALSELRAPGGLLSSVLREGEPVQFVKVDVEGAEIDVIRAHLLPLLRRRLIRHLVVEANPLADGGGLQAGRLRTAQLFSTIAACGYAVRTSALGQQVLVTEANLTRYLSAPRFSSSRIGEDFHFELLTPSGGKRRAVDRSHSLCCASGHQAAHEAASCTCQQHQTVERTRAGSGRECTQVEN